MSAYDLVGNAEDRFSHDASYIKVGLKGLYYTGVLEFHHENKSV